MKCIGCEKQAVVRVTGVFSNREVTTELCTECWDGRTESTNKNDKFKEGTNKILVLHTQELDDE